MLLRIVLILSLCSIAACGRFSDRYGAGPADGAKGPAMENVINPAGLKVPATAVDTTPSSGYWNCGEGFNGYAAPEHAVRCTLHAPK